MLLDLTLRLLVTSVYTRWKVFAHLPGCSVVQTRAKCGDSSLRSEWQPQQGCDQNDRLEASLFGGGTFFRAAVCLEDSLAHAQGLGRDLYQLVVGDEFDCLLQREVTERD